MKFIQKKYGPYKAGVECFACKTLFENASICPHCGNDKGNLPVVVRNAWTQVPQWLNLIFLSYLFWGQGLEKREDGPSDTD